MKTKHPAPGQLEMPITYVSTWVKVPQPNGDILHKPGKPIALGDYIKVREAAHLLGLSITRIHDLIQSGAIPADAVRRPGSPQRGQYRILRSAILARLAPANLE